MRITDLELLVIESVAAPKPSTVRKSQQHQSIGPRPPYFLVLISGRKVIGQRGYRLAVQGDPVALDVKGDSFLVEFRLVWQPLVRVDRPVDIRDRPAPLNCLEIVGGGWLLVVIVPCCHRD